MLGNFEAAKYSSHLMPCFYLDHCRNKNVEGHLDECDFEISKHHCQFQIIFYSFDNNTSL